MRYPFPSIVAMPKEQVGFPNPVKNSYKKSAESLQHFFSFILYRFSEKCALNCL